MKYRMTGLRRFSTWGCAPVLAALLCAAPALAQPSGAEAAHDPDAGRLGAWGLIALGAAVIVVFFGAGRSGGDKETSGETSDKPGTGTNIPMLGRLQQRIEQETSGWRRYQWPVIGLIFIVIGVLMLYRGA